MWTEISEDRVQNWYQEYLMDIPFFNYRPDFWEFVELKIEDDELRYNEDTGKFYTKE